VSATTRRGTFVGAERATNLVLIFENAYINDVPAFVVRTHRGGASFFEGGVSRTTTVAKSVVEKSSDLSILYDPLRSRVHKKKRLLKVKSCKAIGRAVKGGNLPFITTLMLCLSVEDVVASAPGFDRSLHRSNARREIHARMTIDPFQTSDRSIRFKRPIDRSKSFPFIIYHHLEKEKVQYTGKTKQKIFKDTKN